MRSTDRGTHNDGVNYNITDAGIEGATAASVVSTASVDIMLDRKVDITQGAAKETEELTLGVDTCRDRLAGVKANERSDLSFYRCHLMRRGINQAWWR